MDIFKNQKNSFQKGSGHSAMSSSTYITSSSYITIQDHSWVFHAVQWLNLKGFSNIRSDIFDELGVFFFASEEREKSWL